jgi:gamma-glutamyltranspeptidase/glutathione hydrolase
LDRLGQEGPGFLYTGDVGEAISDWVLERGGLITRSDLANYEVVEREPVSATYRAREVVTNPPPSAGGILIIYALELLERVQRAGDLRALVEVMNQANTARSEEFVRCLHRPGMAERLVGVENIDRMASRVLSKLGSTTHIAVLDELGGCASVTCSNGSGSGVAVPGTGVHLNNMMGEQDLNPFGYHTYQPGYRMPSMMAPTVVTSDERPEIVLGSAGSNRIRSAILQTIVNVVEHDMGLTEAVASPRMHLEGLAIDAEPGIDASALASLQADGWPVRRWEQQNLFFGGVQACGFDRRTDTMVGAGDPRRGGASAVVD